jgi:hypothetical protein
MQTLTRKATGVSLYIFEDSEAVVHADTMTHIGTPLTMTILDCDNQNTILYKNVTPPEDWAGWKYFFDGTTWTPNLDWVAPNLA